MHFLSFSAPLHLRLISPVRRPRPRKPEEPDFTLRAAAVSRRTPAIRRCATPHTPGESPRTSTAPIYAALAQRDLLPAQHIVDAGYVDAELLASSVTEHGVTLIGPTRENRSWQARAGTGYDASHFQIDWEHRQVTCPQGITTRGWYLTLNRFGTLEILIQFNREVCTACAARALCTKAKGGRRVVIQPREKQEALRLAREYATSLEWQTLYRQRAGIEGTLSQGIRALGLRHARYRGLRKTAVQHVATCAAINALRAVNWLSGEKPGRTRVSRFSQLALPA